MRRCQGARSRCLKSPIERAAAQNIRGASDQRGHTNSRFGSVVRGVVGAGVPDPGLGPGGHLGAADRRAVGRGRRSGRRGSHRRAVLAEDRRAHHADHRGPRPGFRPPGPSGTGRWSEWCGAQSHPTGLRRRTDHPAAPCQRARRRSVARAGRRGRDARSSSDPRFSPTRFVRRAISQRSGSSTISGRTCERQGASAPTSRTRGRCSGRSMSSSAS